MRKYVVTRTEIFTTVVHADSEEDAEYAAVVKGEFTFVDSEYSVEEVGE